MYIFIEREREREVYISRKHASIDTELGVTKSNTCTSSSVPKIPRLTGGGYHK